MLKTFLALSWLISWTALAEAPTPPEPAPKIELPAPVWHTDFAAASALAKESGKSVLLLFTGSDWCAPCHRLKQESLSHPDFIKHARKHYVLVELDFPHRKSQSERLKHQNRQLKSKFHVGGFPSLILLNSEGEEVTRVEGYSSGGPNVLLKRLQPASKDVD